MQPIEQLRVSFLEMFPMAAEYSPLQLVHAMGSVPLSFYLNNEGMVTGKPQQNFDSRKTKIHDDDYQTLFD